MEINSDPPQPLSQVSASLVSVPLQADNLSGPHLPRIADHSCKLPQVSLLHLAFSLDLVHQLKDQVVLVRCWLLLAV